MTTNQPFTKRMNPPVVIQTTKPKPKPKLRRCPKSGAYFPLFEHMSREHGLTLLDSEMEEIVRVVRKMTSPGVWVSAASRQNRGTR